MNKFIKLLFIFTLLMLFSINVKAACSDKELNDFVEKLEIEFVYPEEKSEYAYYFTLSEEKYKGEGIENILELEALDGNGVAGEWKYQDVIKKYGVGGYTNINEETYVLNVKAIAGACKGQTLKHDTHTIPQFNMYIQTRYCEKYPDHKLCKRFTNDTKGMSDNEFATAMKEYEKEIKKDEQNKYIAFILKYYSYVLCVVVPVVVISIYYNRRIKRFRAMRNREEVRGNKKKKIGLFIILLLVLSVRVNAAKILFFLKINI